MFLSSVTHTHTNLNHLNKLAARKASKKKDVLVSLVNGGNAKRQASFKSKLVESDNISNQETTTMESSVGRQVRQSERVVHANSESALEAKAADGAACHWERTSLDDDHTCCQLRKRNTTTTTPTTTMFAASASSPTNTNTRSAQNYNQFQPGMNIYSFGERGGQKKEEEEEEQEEQEEEQEVVGKEGEENGDSNDHDDHDHYEENGFVEQRKFGRREQLFNKRENCSCSCKSAPNLVFESEVIVRRDSTDNNNVNKQELSMMNNSTCPWCMSRKSHSIGENSTPCEEKSCRVCCTCCCGFVLPVDDNSTTKSDADDDYHNSFSHQIIATNEESNNISNEKHFIN